MTVAERQTDGIFRISTHAIERRLEAEGATPDQAVRLTRKFRREAEEVIWNDLSRALPLSRDARQIFIHPARLNPVPRRYRLTSHERHGRSSSRRPTTIGEYLIVDGICYVIDSGIVATTIVPDPLQMESIERIDGFRVANDPVRLLPLLEQLEIRAKPIGPPPSSGTREIPAAEYGRCLPRPELPVPRWMKKPDARWIVAVVNDMDANGEARRLAAKVRAEYGDVWPQPVLCDTGSPTVAETIATIAPGKRRLVVRDIPVPPRFSPKAVRAGIPMGLLRWWRDILPERGMAPSGHKLLTLATEPFASAILSLVELDGEYPFEDPSSAPALLRIRWRPEHDDRSPFLATREPF